MFFILSKLLNFMLTPIIWIIGCFLYGLITKHQGRKKWFLWTALVLLIIFTNPFLGNLVVKKWEVPYKRMSELSKNYDYGIVLGGIAEWDAAYKRLIFKGSTDRLAQAVDLYKTGRIKKLLLSGGSGSETKPEDKEMEFIRDYLLQVGVPEDDILVEPNSRNTHENAKFVAELMDGKEGSYLLITSAFHMRRAEGCFKKEGIKVFSWPVDRISMQEDEELNIKNLIIPSTEYLLNWTLLLKEILGYQIYRIMGYC
jgi:uncharacterized SAM-binding protein YcdF (DUF218 family)